VDRVRGSGVVICDEQAAADNEVGVGKWADAWRNLNINPRKVSQ
jgi:hypothetical protein